MYRLKSQELVQGFLRVNLGSFDAPSLGCLDEILAFANHKTDFLNSLGAKLLNSSHQDRLVREWKKV